MLTMLYGGGGEGGHAACWSKNGGRVEQFWRNSKLSHLAPPIKPCMLKGSSIPKVRAPQVKNVRFSQLDNFFVLPPMNLILESSKELFNGRV